jgi:triacylglycerol lipase
MVMYKGYHAVVAAPRQARAPSTFDAARRPTPPHRNRPETTRGLRAEPAPNETARMRFHALAMLAAATVFALPACSAAPDDSAAAESAETAPDLSGAPYPVVLMHGMAGFGELKVGPVEVTYFKDVIADLTKRGESAFITIVPPYDTSEVRAAAAATQIDAILKQTGKKKVNLIGHSQGGLDARVLASPNGLGWGDKIASITTVSTPHHGTAVADALLAAVDALPAGGAIADDVVNDALELLEITAYELQTDPDIRAQGTELTTAYMEKTFNPKYVDDPRVVYTSYAGRTNLETGLLDCGDAVYKNDPFSLDLVQPAFAATAVFLTDGLHLRDNDGLVTVASARWGTFQQCLPADHLQEVGQFAPFASTFDQVAFFRTVVERVRSAGF